MIRLLELFGGIGACTAALKRAKIEYEIVDYVEIDKYAVKSYNAINDTNFVPQDIKNWDKDLQVDLIMHGSPCQDFSVAGEQKGGDKESGTNSSLMWDTVRIVRNLKPKIVIWENVKNVLSQKHKHNFDAYIKTMTNLGYTNYYDILNSIDYGIPQNRERIFVVSVLNEFKNNFTFSHSNTINLKLEDILENKVDEKFYVNNTYDIDKSLKKIVIDDLYKNRPLRIYNDYAPTLRASRSGLKTIDDDFRVRKLTPKEYWRLMGFSDDEFEKAKAVNSNTQLYKQAGNSIVVNILVDILKKLLI